MQETEKAALFEFITACKEKGASDEFLAAFLPRTGWPAEDVYSCLSAYWQKATGVSLPVRAGGGGSARDAFLYLLSFSTLATWSTALGSLLFKFIERCFPDPVMAGRLAYARHEETWQMACLGVAFPIFLFAMWTILREARHRPESLESGVRKWLTYIALLLTAGSVICDLIWFLDYFLTGELSVRFVLKAAAVLLICAAIFAYYLSSLQWDRKADMNEIGRRSKRFAAGASTAIVAAFCAGLLMAGSPSTQRHLEADHQRVEDLKAIAYAVNNAYRISAINHDAVLLPGSLEDLQHSGLPQPKAVDPETRRPYRYTKRSVDGYQLCATFSVPEPENEMRPGAFWNHGSGETCFVLRANVDVPAY